MMARSTGSSARAPPRHFQARKASSVEAWETMPSSSRVFDSEASREAMYSTVHGAGRVMSRTAAKGKFVLEDGKRIRKEGLVRHDEMMKWLHERGVTLRGGDLDEAPQAYRRLPEVLAAHAGTIRVLHVLKPVGVVMAGRDIRDPYKINQGPVASFATGSANLPSVMVIASAVVRLELLRSSEVEQSGSDPGLAAGSNPAGTRAEVRVSISLGRLSPHTVFFG